MKTISVAYVSIILLFYLGSFLESVIPKDNWLYLPTITLIGSLIMTQVMFTILNFIKAVNNAKKNKTD